MTAAPLLFAADERYGPAEFFKLLSDSRIQYAVDSAPVKDPVPDDKCDRRAPEDQRTETGPHIALKRWESAPEAKAHFEKAEALYKENKLAEAGSEYAAGLKLEPGYAAGWLYSGDVPYGLKKWEDALAAYRKAEELDPSIAQAHRFAADALSHLGRYGEAETEYINAIAWDPGYKEAWQALENLGRATGFRVEQHPFTPPPAILGKTDKGVEIGVVRDDPAAGPWLAYASCKAAWRFEPGFRMRRLGVEKDDTWSWTSTEESECVESYIEASFNNVNDEREKKHEKALEGDALISALPDEIRFLVDVMKADMLSEYVVFDDFGRRCPAGFAALPRETIDKIEDYIRKFVVVHVGPPAGGKTS